MICKSCQKAIDESHAYCIYCGVPQATNAQTQEIPTSGTVPYPPFYPVVPTMAPPVMYQPVMSYYPPRPVYPPDFIPQTVKRLAKSILYTLGLTFLGLSFLCSLALLILQVAWGQPAIQSMMGPYEFSYEFSLLPPAQSMGFSVASYVACALTMIVSFLMLISLFKIFVAARKPERSLVGGARLLRTTAILSCITAVISRFVTAALENVPGNYYDEFDDFTIPVSFFSPTGAMPSAVLDGSFWISTIFSALFSSVVIVLLYSFAIAAISNFHQSVKGGMPNARGSIYLAVLLFIGAAGAAFSTTFSEPFLFGFEGGGVAEMLVLSIGTLEGLLSGVAMLMFGLLICKYNSSVHSGILPESAK